jgi:hypothetical protein
VLSLFSRSRTPFLASRSQVRQREKSCYLYRSAVAVNCSGPPLLLSALDHYRCSPYWSTMADAYRRPLLLLLVLDADPPWLLIALVSTVHTRFCLHWSSTPAICLGPLLLLPLLVHRGGYLHWFTTAAICTNPLQLLSVLIHYSCFYLHWSTTPAMEAAWLVLLREMAPCIMVTSCPANSANFSYLKCYMV